MSAILISSGVSDSSGLASLGLLVSGADAPEHGSRHCCHRFGVSVWVLCSKIFVALKAPKRVGLSISFLWLGILFLWLALLGLVSGLGCSVTSIGVKSVSGGPCPRLSASLASLSLLTISTFQKGSGLILLSCRLKE